MSEVAVEPRTAVVLRVAQAKLKQRQPAQQPLNRWGAVINYSTHETFMLPLHTTPLPLSPLSGSPRKPIAIGCWGRLQHTRKAQKLPTHN